MKIPQKASDDASAVAGDQPTLDYYNANAEQVFASYEQVSGGVSDYFQASFWPGARILDVGAGSGRDLRTLLDMGYNAYGIEPSNGLRELAIAAHPILSDRLLAGGLPEPIDFYPGSFDGIVCSAVLMHIPHSQLFDALITLRNLLKDNGRMLLSIPAARPDVVAQRDAKGRLFETLQAEQLKLLCSRLGLDCITEYHNDDAMGRAETRWVTLLLVKRASLGQPLDRIESVLRNDKKVATYKLALLRALCDLADNDDRAVSWLPSGQVAVPLMKIAEQWLLYYWPLVAHPQLIPQMQGEASGKHVLAFRPLLRELIVATSHHYQLDGEPQRLSLFMLEWKRGRLPDAISKLLGKTLRKIASTIVKGPVTYADDGTMFSYDKTTGSVCVDAELWREFCLTGYWVRDSLLLRWAELVARLSGSLPYVSPGVVMDLLLQRPDVQRQQRVAAGIFAELPNLRCVWSERAIPPGKLAMDHVLPFSIWLNNDLWNLQPSHTSVNSAKSDGVPSTRLLRTREAALVDNWRIAHDAEPQLFRYEVERTLGSFNKHGWEMQLFEHLRGKAEMAVYAARARVWDGIY